MRLDQELVQRKLSESRTEAQELISAGFVIVNDVVTTKQTKHVTETDRITVTSRRPFVSRGGEKLQGALRDIYGSDTDIANTCKDTHVLDIGSSTGGFTDCILSYGAKSVDAVDVGTLQLHEKLRKDTRVSLFENTDIRNFDQGKHYDLIVADMSFIQLSTVMDDIMRLSKEKTEYFLLIKPQFEVGKGKTKKGIVKDTTITQIILDNYKQVAEERGLVDIQIIPSHLQGGDGNQEYFLYGKKLK